MTVTVTGEELVILLTREDLFNEKVFLVEYLDLQLACESHNCCH